MVLKMQIDGLATNSSDLNLIENLRAIIKQKIYVDERQFYNLDTRWNAIEDACGSIKPCQVRKLTSSIGKYLFKILKNGGGYVAA